MFRTEVAVRACPARCQRSRTSAAISWAINRLPSMVNSIASAVWVQKSGSCIVAFLSKEDERTPPPLFALQHRSVP